MHRFVLAVGFLLCFSAVAQAQNYSQWEFYGGFDYLHANACPVAQAITGNPNTCSVPLGNGTSVSLSQNSYGWHGTIGENTTSWFGGVLDFSGDYANRIVNFGTNTAPDDVRFNLSAYPFLFG